MNKIRRTFSPEFKSEAVRLVREEGYPVAETARNLDIHEDDRFFGMKGMAYFRFYSNPIRFFRLYRDMPQRNLIWLLVKWVLFITFLFGYKKNKNIKGAK